MNVTAAAAIKKVATRYQRELDRLPESYAIAQQWDVGPIVRVLSQAAEKPLMVVGSGGSFSVATYCAELHTRATGLLAKAVTPLTIAATREGRDYGLLCVSASGRNVDIRAAFEHGMRLELRPAIAFTLDSEAPLHRLAGEYGYADSVTGPQAAEPDGFLAVGSVLVTCLVFARAYRVLAGEEDRYARSFEEFMDLALPSTTLSRISDEIAELGAARTTSVLFSPEVEAAAVDLESRFVEAALGHLHTADLRNFGHGRHNWMAKRSEGTAVLCLATEGYAGLAERTIKMLPPEIALVKAEFAGASDIAGLAGLMVALHVAAGAGRAIGVDPGRPGIPEFGRKLFRLSPPKPVLGVDPVIERKRRAIESVGGVADDKTLVAARSASLAAIEVADIEGVVLDYDGTLCDMRRRFDALSGEMAAAIIRLVGLGLRVGVATGRGKSVGKALREALPEEMWKEICIGYYNGAECVALSEQDAPLGREPSAWSKPIAEALAAHNPYWTVEPRAAQVTVTPKGRCAIPSLMAEIAALLDGGGALAPMVTSSHSVDVLKPGVSKLALVAVLGEMFKIAPEGILRIGDRGAAPGNDYALLRHPLGMSVDEVSADLDSCWRWSAAGCLGPAATLGYLNGLARTPKGVRWSSVGRTANDER